MVININHPPQVHFRGFTTEVRITTNCYEYIDMADQEDIENCVMLHLSSSSEDENQMEIPIRKGNQKKGSPREKMGMYKQGTFHSLRKKAVWFEEETIEPCRSPQRDENTGDSDHVEEFEDHDDMDVLENDSNVQDDEIEERFSNFGGEYTLPYILISLYY